MGKYKDNHISACMLNSKAKLLSDMLTLLYMEVLGQ